MDQLGAVSEVTVGDGFAVITVVRKKSGLPVAYTVNLIRTESGLWRIESMLNAGMMHKKVYLLIILCCMFMLLACDKDHGYSSGKELRGVVVNADTGEPIPDAIVVAKWITSTGTAGGSELVCFHAGTATTNAAGEYYSRPGGKKAPSVPSTAGHYGLCL